MNYLIFETITLIFTNRRRIYHSKFVVSALITDLIKVKTKKIEIMDTKKQIREKAQTTFKNHLEYLSSGQIEQWVDLFIEEGILEFPYGPAGFPKRVQGKTDLYEYMKNFPEHFKVIFKNLHFHPTEEPTLVIAEFESSGHAISTGNPYMQKYISVVTTDIEGKIIRYVDFWNPMVAIDAINAPLTDFVKK